MSEGIAPGLSEGRLQPPVLLRPPTTSSATAPSAFSPPTPEWMSGTWHVAHSTLPMWKSKRNVTITYTVFKDPADGVSKFDNLVEYYPLNSGSKKEVRGIETPQNNGSGEWHWRGKGWLKVASSHWEILGHAGAKQQDISNAPDDQWVVIFFAKTLFTPAGIDILSRTKAGLGDSLTQRIKEELARVDDANIQQLAREMFEVLRN